MSAVREPVELLGSETQPAGEFAGGSQTQARPGCGRSLDTFQACQAAHDPSWFGRRQFFRFDVIHKINGGTAPTRLVKREFFGVEHRAIRAATRANHNTPSG